MNAQVTNEMRAHRFLILQNADFGSSLQSFSKMNKSLVRASGTQDHTDMGFWKLS